MNLNYEYVLFDFDNTLATHMSYAPGTDDVELVAYLKGNTFFYDVEKSKHLQKFMDLLYEKHVPMGLCSAISVDTMSIRAEAKIEWVIDNYGYRLKNMCVKSWSAKSKMCELLQQALGCNAKEILIIDDSYDVLEDCARKGFSVCTPLHIVNLISQ